MLVIFLQKLSLSDFCGLGLGIVAEMAVSTVPWALDLVYSFTADFKASSRYIELCCKKKEYSSISNIAAQHVMIRKGKSNSKWALPIAYCVIM